ncbi:CbbBc protein [Halomonas huangheensis]|nr:CbbBc protein [Halomonas huangheensis]
MTRHPRVSAYAGPAGGWGALRSVSRHVKRSRAPWKSVRSLLRTNQAEGFDCPGCAWGDSEHRSSFEFCENGAKAVAWEVTGKRLTAEFFTRHTVAELLGWDDFMLEDQGRLSEPLRYDPQTDRYIAVTWREAIAAIAERLAELESPDQALFYTSGRASNEAAYLYQLFVRLFGTNNFPDCSNMCHEASGIGMEASLGVGKGTVLLEDFEHADAILVFGQNPGTNHPRMLGDLRRASRRGARIVSFNPLRERGLERFADPQVPLEMATLSSQPISSRYYQPRMGGDMAAVRGIAKALFAMEERGDFQRAEAFITAHTQGIEEWETVVRSTEWMAIESQSGLSRVQLEEAATIYAASRNVICTWAMGITQHLHAVGSVREIINLLLLGGHFGRPGAGACPVRGHSNVQGDRTMGIDEKAPGWLIDALEERYGVKLPRELGYNTVESLAALEQGKAQTFIGLGGNFSRATPDTERTEAAMRKLRLNVQISTKLNRSHLVVGAETEAFILPCLGRSEVDASDEVERQAVSVEDSMSMVHASVGFKEPASPLLRSEPWIVASIAEATLLRVLPQRGENANIDWMALVANYDRIRDEIAAVIPGFDDFNLRLAKPRGFHLSNPVRELRFPTESGKACFAADPLPEAILHQQMAQRDGWLTLQTMRSHDQYNTTVYGYNDRYRGVSGQRRVLFINQIDLQRLGLADGDWVDLVGEPRNDGSERRAPSFRLVKYDIPSGCVGAYYPETNVLVALESHGADTGTPASKAIPIRLERSNRIV